jgi:tape measure domain-containing protein
VATEIAQAYVALIPQFKGVQKEIEREVGGADLSGAGQKSGKSWLGGAAKIMGGAAVAAIGATAGIAIKKGIDRALTLENAEAKLTGLGHSTESVAAIMDNALASVRGTAFGMGDAATVAASAVAAGIKPGEDLTRTLKLAGDAATIAGTDMGSMGAIFNKVAASNKVQMDVINQLHDQGVPALALLADQLGVTAEEASKMASKGEIDFATFQDAMEKGMGGAALKSGETTQGAFNNMMAALGRLGEKAISGVFPKFAGLFTGITGLIDKMGPSVQAFGEWTGVMFDKVSAGAGAIATLLGGEFNASVREALGVEEDSGLVDALLSINAIAGGVKDTLGGVVGILKDGDFNGEAFAWLGSQEDSPLVDTLFRIREGVIAAKDEVAGGLTAMVQAFKDGGNDVTSSGFAGFLEQLGLIGRMLWDSLGPTISALLPQILGLVSAFSPLGLVLDVLTPILPQVGDALAAIAGALTGSLAAILPVVVDLMAALAGTLSGALVAILPTVVNLVKALVGVFSGALVKILPTVVTLISTLAGVIAEILPLLLPLILQGVQVLAQALSGALATALPVIVGLVSSLAGVIAAVLPALVPVIGALLDGLLPVVGALLPPLLSLVQSVLPLLAGVIMALLPAVVPIVQILGKVLTPVIGVLSGVLQFLIGVVSSVITWFVDLVGGADGLKRGVTGAWQGIQAGMTTVWNFIRDWIFAPIKTGVALVGDGFTAAKNVMTGAFDLVKTGVESAWNFMRDKVFDPLKAGVAAVGTAFEGARDVAASAFNKLANLARTPINFILGTVYNDGIRAGFNTIAGAVGLDLRLPVANLAPEFRAATGGVLPGWTPGRDVHHFSSPTGGRLHLSGGEAIMRPEFTRAVGGAAGVARLNAQARSGALGDRSFFLGGVWDNVKNVAGNVGQFVSNAASGVKDMVLNVASFLSDPAEGFKSLITAPMNSLLDTVMAGDLGRMMVEVPKKAISGVIDKALSLIGMSGGGSDLPDMMAAGGWARPSRGRITSAFGPRWGAFHNGTDFAGGGATYAAGAGRVSKVGWNVGYGNTGIGILLNHGGGLETYYGHNPSLSAVRVRPGDTVRPGQHIGQEGATGNVTGVHLHWSAFRGGKAFNPMSLLGSGGGGGRGASLFDNGGWLNPGEYGVNLSSRPEPVFNAEQWDVLKGNLDKPGGGNVFNVKVEATDASTAREIARQQVIALQDEITRAGLMGVGV